MADANSKDREISAITTCEDKNSSCLRGPAPAGKPRGMRMPAANDALPIARAPLGRADASAGMTSAAPLVSSERVPERGTAGRPRQHNADKTAVDSDEAHSNRLSHKTPHKSARSQNRQAPSYGEDRAAYRIGRGYDGPVGELGRAFAHERLYGQKGFWEWSR
jgi:hypothetical protein